MILAFYSPIVGQILAVVFTLVLLILSLKPRLVILFYFLFRIVLQPYIMNQVQLFGTSVASFLSVGIFCATLVSMVRTTGKSTIFPKYMWPMAVLILLAVVSFIYSIDRSGTAIYILRHISSLCVGVICYNIINNRDDFVLLIKDVCKIAWIPILFGLYQKITGFYFPWKEAMYSQYEMGYRISSLFAMYNEYGIYLSMVIMCAIFLVIIADSRAERIKYLLVLTMAILNLLFSLNRGSWIAVGVGLLAAIVIFWRFLKVRYFIMAGFAGSFVAVPIIVNRFYDLVRPSSWGGHHNTFLGRVQGWESLLSIGFEKFFTGWGAGTSFALSMLKFGGPSAPHNDYLRLFLEFGFLGFFMLVIFLLAIWFIPLRHRRSAVDWPVNFLLFSVVTYYIVISVAQNILYNLVNFPLFLLICSCCIKYLSLPAAERYILAKDAPPAG